MYLKASEPTCSVFSTTSSGLVGQQSCGKAVQSRSWEAVWKAACYRSGGEIPDGEGGPPASLADFKKKTK